MTRVRHLLPAALCLLASARGANYYFDTNGVSPGSGAVNGASYPWGDANWSTSTDGSSSTIVQPSRNNSYFSAGTDGHASINLTGATGEIGSVIVQEGSVTIQSLTRIFNGGSVLQTLAGTSLNIRNSPDFYDRTVTFDTAAGTTITIAGINSGGVRRAYLTKTGPGLVVFQGANVGAAGGTITIDDGEYRIQNSNSIASGSAIVNAGGTLSVANNISPARALSVNGPGFDSLGALRSVSGNNSWNGLITLGSGAEIQADAGATLTLNPTSGDSVSGAHPLTFGGAGTITVSKPIGAVTSLTKSGPGTLVFGAAHSYPGATTVGEGTLRLVETSGVLASTSGIYQIEATLEINHANPQTVANSIAGGSGGMVNKLGGGSLTLTAASPFAGTVNILGGSMSLAPTASLSSARLIQLATGTTLNIAAVPAFTLGTGQTLGGLGTIQGPVAASVGSTLSPGAPGLPGALAFTDHQSWMGGVTASLDLADTPAGVEDLVTIAGNLALSGSNTIRIGYSTLANGTYALIRTSGGTISGDVSLLRLDGFVPGSQIAALQLNGAATELSLVVSNNTYTARNLTWTGNGSSNAWDQGNTTAWLTAGNPAAFTDTDHVTFDETGAANPVVTLVGNAAPGSINFSDTSDYTLTGTGAIIGPSTLTKTGGGTLVVANGNGFTGGTTVAAGTLEIRAEPALGNGPVSNNATLVFAPPAPITFDNIVSGNGLLDHRGGTTNLNAANTFSGPVVISGGSLVLGNSAALGEASAGTSVLSGAILDLNGQAIAAEPLVLNGGTLRNDPITPASWAGAVSVAAASTIDCANALTLAGPLTGTFMLTKSGAGTLTLAGSSPLGGPITVNAGKLTVSGGSGPVTIQPGAVLGGNGTIHGPASVAGQLAPGLAPAHLTIEGPLLLQAGSITTLRVRRSLASFSHNRVSAQQMAFGGALGIVLEGAQPQEGDIYPLFEANSFSGTFASIQLPFLSGDLQWDESRLGIDGTLRVIALPDVSTLEQRRRWLFTRLGDNPGGVDGFSAAGGFFARGDIETGRACALSRSRSLLANHQGGPVQVDLFHIWPAIDLAIRYGQYLDAETHANIREVVLTFNQYQDTTTSNLKTLSWVTRFLGGQLYGEAAFDAAVDGNGQPVTNDWRASDPNARNTLLGHINTVVGTGYGEIASRPYFWKNLLPMLSLGQLATDPVVRTRSAFAYEAGLAQSAGYWLRGHLGMPTSRSYPDVLDQFPVTSLGLLWFHFGGDIPALDSDSALMTAVMNPAVSPLLELAGSDRSSPYLSRSRNGSNYLQAWVEREFILFADGPFGPNSGQVYPNGVVWTDSNRSRYSHLWVTKPIQDDSGLYVSATHGKESRQFSETVARDALLYSFDIQPPAIEEPSPTPYALGYVPGGYRAMVNDAATSGQIFLHYGSVLVAIRSEIPFGWNPSSGIAFPSATPRDGDSEFIIDGDTNPARPPATLVTPLTSNLRIALAIETARPADFAGATPAEQLAAFRAAILAIPAPSRPADAPTTAVYTTRRGDQLRLTRSQDITTYPVTVNGAPVEYSVFPRIENPWVYQPANSSTLVLRSADRREVFDFTHWTRTVTSGSIDVTPPVLGNVPGNQTITPNHPQPVVTYSASASDLLDGAIPVTFDPASGSVFTPGTTTVVTATATDNSLNYARSTFTVTVLPYATPSAPAAPWSVLNIGAQPVIPGSARHDVANRVFIVSGTGGTSGTGASGDIWNGTTEGFTCVSRPWTGDGVFTARLWSFSAADSGAKAGIMFRETNNAGAKNAITYMGAGGSAFFQHKTSTSGNVSYSSTASRGIPEWIRLVRSGNTFTGYFSDDGVTWTQQGTAITNTMTGTALTVGFAVAPRTGGQTADVIFDNVSFLAAPATPLESWRQQYFGIIENTGNAFDSADPDIDGMANLMEYALGSIPNSAASVARPLLGNSGNRLTLTFTRARSDLTYVAEGGSDLSTWSVIATNPGSVGQSVTVTDTVDISTASPPRRFMRLHVTNP